MSRPTSRGFTLIELLISLLLLGIVLTLVYGAFGQISSAAIEQRDQLTEQQELRLLTRMIADDLQSAQWLDAYWAKGVQARTGIIAELEFVEGKEFTDISFHAARPARFHREADFASDPGLHELGYRVRQNEERTSRLLVRREDYYIDEDLEHGGVEVELADGIETFLVEYLPPDADPNAAEEPWQERWNSTTQSETARMPQAIRLTIARKDAAGRSYSESLQFNLPASLKL